MKTYLAILVGLLLVSGIAGFAIVEAVEHNVDATVTVEELISVTVTPCATTLSFGSNDPGTLDANVSCQGSGAPAIDVSVDSVGNQNVDVDTAGTDFCTDYPTCSGDQIGVGNIEFDKDNAKSNPTVLSLSYQSSTAGVAPGSSAGVWYWMDIGSTQAPGSYSGTLKVQTTAV